MPVSLSNVARLAEPSIVTNSAIRTVGIASRALEALAERFSDRAFAETFEQLVSLLLDARGRVIVTGMGKSGLIARKITATLSSTGTPAMYLHPAEAGHGDLGMITAGDIVIMITRSGETAELAPIVTYCKRFGIPVVAITSRSGSTAARAADLVVRLPSVREACANALTPTTSTTLQLVFGDALALALMELRGFSAEDFYKFHPNGRLGAQLLKVRDLMSSGEEIPRVGVTATLLDATIEMTRARFGGTAIIDDEGRLLGAFTDGDLRRTVTGGGRMDAAVGDWMTRAPLWIRPDELASEALRQMQNRSIMMLFVMDDDGLRGVIHMHDVLRVGIA